MKIKCFYALVMFTVLINFHANENVQKAIELRQEGEYKQAERLLKDYSSPANFESLGSAEKVEFLKGLLELAHNRAMLDDVTGALSLLNWAESQKNSYHRAIACTKYAQILIDMGEFERASAYLKNATESIGNHAKENTNTMAIGQGGSVVDSGAVWRDLSEDIAVLNAEIEAEELQKKFGATYGNYVKLRRLQVLLKRARTPRYLKQALTLADEIVETDPASQFAAAAQYLKGTILASRLNENSSKKDITNVKDYLEKFVRQQPDGLYRGEASMLLGKISLEIEWDAKDAEKYYSQALTYFQKSRERRDAVSLYASINDDLKDQSKPTQRPTTLNQWKRIVYHDEDPLKLYNTANAPTWYIDDNEKNCLFIVGFCAFLNEDYQKALKIWQQGCKLDVDIMNLSSKNWPNTLMRLADAIKYKEMTFSSDLKKLIKNDKNKIKIQTAEFYYILERFDKTAEIYNEIISSKDEDKNAKALSNLGLGLYKDMTVEANSLKERTNIAKHFQIAMQLGEKTPIEEEAIIRMAFFYQAGSETYNEGGKIIDEYLKKYPKGKYIPQIKFRDGMRFMYLQNIDKAKQVSNWLNKRYPNSPYTIQLNNNINDLKLLEFIKNNQIKNKLKNEEK